VGPVVLINPNTNTATTTMMTDIAARRLRDHGIDVVGRTVAAGPPIITEPVALAGAADEVLRAATRAMTQIPDASAFIISAFADPGIDAVTAAASVPVIGIAGAAFRAASISNRRFGIVSPAPALSPAVVELVDRYGCSTTFTGIRSVDISPDVISGDPDALVEAMISLAHDCVIMDGAEAVIIGGGPLGAAAEIIRTRLDITVIAPIIAACDEIARLL